MAVRCTLPVFNCLFSGFTKVAQDMRGFRHKGSGPVSCIVMFTIDTSAPGTISYKHLNIYLVKTWTFLVTLLIDLVSYFFGVMLKRFNGPVGNKYCMQTFIFLSFSILLCCHGHWEHRRKKPLPMVNQLNERTLMKKCNNPFVTYMKLEFERFSGRLVE